jgi:hypothetical protein
MIKKVFIGVMDKRESDALFVWAMQLYMRSQRAFKRKIRVL